MSKMGAHMMQLELDGEIVQCPNCKDGYYTPYGVNKTEIMPPYPALSRRDNKTYICSPCGTQEALDDFFGRGDLPDPRDCAMNAWDGETEAPTF